MASIISSVSTFIYVYFMYKEVYTYFHIAQYPQIPNTVRSTFSRNLLYDRDQLTTGPTAIVVVQLDCSRLLEQHNIVKLILFVDVSEFSNLRCSLVSMWSAASDVSDTHCRVSPAMKPSEVTCCTLARAGS
jgi:hypothetical protein